MKKSFTRKLWIVMKIGAAQLLIALTLCGVAMAHSNFAQLLDKKISVQLNNSEFEDALKEIERSSNIKFAYSIDQLSPQGSISLQITNQRLKDVLDNLLTPRYIQYNVHEKTGTITLKKITPEEPRHQSKIKHTLLPISGTIRDANGQPMAGVNIIIKGTTNGTTSDAEGKYTINAQEGDVLTFSFIGFTSIEMNVSKLSVLDVVLQEDVKSLGEIVINAGYWKVTDHEKTGNISSISSEIIEKQVVSNPLQAMMGRMPGVQITQNTGMPGGSFDVQIRGKNSLRSDGNNPLYIVDGVPFTATSLSDRSVISYAITGGGNPLNSINASDIETIEVLKDADATAIYGARGANGVVLITTKRGKTGKTTFDVNYYSGVGKMTRRMDLLNTQEYVQMRKEAFNNDGLLPNLSNARDLLLWDTTRYTDWQEKLLGGTANFTNAQLNLSGGSENTRFMIGGGYNKQTTVFPGDFSNVKLSTHVNLNHNAYDGKLSLNFYGNYMDDNNNMFDQDVTRMALQLSPNAPEVFDADGNINWENSTWPDVNPFVPFTQKYNIRTDNLITNAQISYEIVKGLSLKTNLGFTKMGVDELKTYPTTSFDPAWGLQSGFSVFGNSSLKTWIAEPQLEYNTQVGSGKLTFLAGSTLQQNQQEGETFYGYGFSSDALLQNKQAASTLSILNASSSTYKYVAWFGRLNFNWLDKYMINITGRRDGSSRFGPGKQFANFGAIGLAWNFSEEPFMDGLPVLSFGKLRTSYGTTGSDQIGDYQYLATYSTTNTLYQGVRGLYPTRLNNPDFAWEVNKKFEIGLETGWANDKVQFKTSYYRNRSSNQLVGYALSAVTGFSSIQANLNAIVQNKGVEFELLIKALSTESLQWTTSASFTLPKNELLEFPNLEGSAYANSFELGNPLNIKKVYQYTGQNPQTGFYTFKDVDGDNLITYPNDTKTVVNLDQIGYGGIENSIKYKSFEFNFFFQWVKQQGANYLDFFQMPGILSNQPREVLSGSINTEPDIQPLSQDFNSEAYTAYYNYSSSDKAYSDASFIRLKSAALSCYLGKGVLEKTKLQSGKLYIQGQNLLTFTNFKGLDPENQNFNALPPLKVVTAGIQLTF